MQIQVLAIGKRASVLGSAVNDQPAIAEDETHLPDYSDIGARDAANECSSGPLAARPDDAAADAPLCPPDRPRPLHEVAQ
jgi:hypothetical protein